MKYNKESLKILAMLDEMGIKLVDELNLYQKRNNIHNFEELKKQVELDYIEYLYQLRF